MGWFVKTFTRRYGKDYKRKRIIRGVKRGVSIALAAGIGTVGAYEAYKYLNGKISEYRKTKSAYERLIFIGEHNRYKKEDGTGIDLQKYANAYTNGDVEKAIILLQEKTKNEEIQLINMIEEKYCIKHKEER